MRIVNIRIRHLDAACQGGVRNRAAIGHFKGTVGQGQHGLVVSAVDDNGNGNRCGRCAVFVHSHGLEVQRELLSRAKGVNGIAARRQGKGIFAGGFVEIQRTIERLRGMRLPGGVDVDNRGVAATSAGICASARNHVCADGSGLGRAILDKGASHGTRRKLAGICAQMLVGICAGSSGDKAIRQRGAGIGILACQRALNRIFIAVAVGRGIPCAGRHMGVAAVQPSVVLQRKGLARHCGRIVGALHVDGDIVRHRIAMTVRNGNGVIQGFSFAFGQTCGFGLINGVAV